ncbi:MAG: 30S ribosomal protein S6 [Planctomycetaceae bacterium]|nr:30S ribosomal protein S6 [Planctomycetales bacterium]MCB9872766.1 30S ribosomal protein S6 [Planctomycetaceae bacterium]MCB9926252.1 30S ribosomal protein S6 [Planctomycetaceae bacterium]
MAQNFYECLYILDSNRYARDPNGISASIPEMIEGLEGEVLASRLWNEQRLAYPINGQRKGTYWLTYFRLDSTRLSEFNRACQLNENILRNLTLKVDPRLIDALVAHALGKTVAPTSALEDDLDDDSDDSIGEEASEESAEAVAEG